MLAKNLESLYQNFGRESTDFDFCEEFDQYDIQYPIPYTLVIECDQNVGNFERELIGYSLGILDGVQMHIDYAHSERSLFWKEIFNKDEPIEDLQEYELFEKYLYEIFETCDDWRQITFYNIGSVDEQHSCIKIYFYELPSILWRKIIISRIKKFFETFRSTTAKNANITALYFEDKNKEKIINYI